jgi:hypothetical protein
VQWLTQWPVTAEAIGVFSPSKPNALFVQYVNHAPLARRFADKAETVEWGGESSIRKATAVLEQRAARVDRVAVIGPMPFEQHAALAEKFGKIINLNRTYVRMRSVKSTPTLPCDRARLCSRGRLHLHPFHRHVFDVRFTIGGTTAIPLGAPFGKGRRGGS